MTRPIRGRLPYSASPIVAPTFTEFIRPCVDGYQWRPKSATDSVSFYFYQPRYDVGSAFNVRVHWSTSNTSASNSATFRVRYAKLTIGTTAVANGSTALDTTITASAATTTANSINRTAAGVINGGTVTDGQALVLTLDLPTVSGLTVDLNGTDRIVVHGIELEYTLTNL